MAKPKKCSKGDRMYHTPIQPKDIKQKEISEQVFQTGKITTLAG